MKSCNEILRKNLKRLRKDNKYTQNKISEVLEVEEKHYSSLETGRYNFTLKNIDKLASFYNIEPWRLFREDLFSDEK